MRNQIKPDNDAISSEASTIHLAQTEGEITENSQLYFTSACYRKIKGQENPYAYTRRTNNPLPQNRNHLISPLQRDKPRKKLFSK